MAKRLPSVGLMDLGTLDELKKFYATNISQPESIQIEKENEIAEENLCERSTSDSITSNKKLHSATC